jgi:hypothetical protein
MARVQSDGIQHGLSKLKKTSASKASSSVFWVLQRLHKMTSILSIQLVLGQL